MGAPSSRTGRAASPEEAREALRSEVRGNKRILFGSIAFAWALELFDTFLGGPLDAYGIWPREPQGLLGVLTAPLLHGGFGHLLGNTIGFFFLGGMLLLRDRREFYAATLVGFASGFAVWAFGRGGSVHLGASGLIFTYFGYLLTIGFWERRLGSILLSIFILLGWGSMVFGAFPTDEPISWEGHLFGLVGGVVLAAFVGGRRRRARKANG